MQGHARPSIFKHEIMLCVGAGHVSGCQCPGGAVESPVMQLTSLYTLGTGAALMQHQGIHDLSIVPVWKLSQVQLARQEQHASEVSKSSTS